MRLMCNETQRQIILLGGRLRLMPKGMEGDRQTVSDDVAQHPEVQRMLNATPPWVSLHSPEAAAQRVQPAPVEVAVTPPKAEPKPELPKKEEPVPVAKVSSKEEPHAPVAEVHPEKEAETDKEFLAEKATSRSTDDTESVHKPDSKKSRPARRR